MDLLEAYRRSQAAFTDTVARVGADQWNQPTPCDLWDVRNLVNHIVYEDRWSVPLVEGASLADVGDRFEGDLLGDDPLAAVRGALADSDAAFSAPGALGRSVQLSFGETPAEVYLRQLLADHLVHGWDLAAAIGGPRTLDPDVVDEVARWWVGEEEAYRAGGAVAAAVPVTPDADAQDRLIATFGRDPGWRPRAG